MPNSTSPSMSFSFETPTVTALSGVVSMTVGNSFSNHSLYLYIRSPTRRVYKFNLPRPWRDGLGLPMPVSGTRRHRHLGVKSILSQIWEI